MNWILNYSFINMKMKFLYNTLLTLGIVFMFFRAIASYQCQYYQLMAVSVAVLLLMFWFKVRLLKDVKQTMKKK